MGGSLRSLPNEEPMSRSSISLHESTITQSVEFSCPDPFADVQGRSVPFTELAKMLRENSSSKDFTKSSVRFGEFRRGVSERGTVFRTLRRSDMTTPTDTKTRQPGGTYPGRWLNDVPERLGTGRKPTVNPVGGRPS